MNKGLYLLIVLQLVIRSFTYGQTCGLDTLAGSMRRFLPDYPLNSPIEGYEYRFDTLLDGQWKQYRERQGHVFAIWSIVHGKLNGAMAYFNSWGEKTAIECYDQGIPRSVSTFYSNGLLMDSWTFEPYDILVSRKSWHPNGVLHIEATTSFQKRWWDNGILRIRKRFVGGSLSEVEIFTKDGKPFYHGFWNGKQPISGRQFLYDRDRARIIEFVKLSLEVKELIHSNDFGFTPIVYK